MKPARLQYLAQNNAQPRKVIAKEAVGPGGSTILSLECGHTQCVASHFDCRGIETTRCTKCGEAWVRAQPRYQAEGFEP